MPINRDYLITELEKQGFKSNRNILYDDRTALNREGNTFIADLTEANYSQYMQDIFEKLIWIEDEAMTQYNKKWTNSKVVRKETTDPKTGSITDTTTERHLLLRLHNQRQYFLESLKTFRN